jgi:hypothetical protein
MMKIGILCEDEARFRQILEALKNAEFCRASSEHDGPHLEVILVDQEHAEEIYGSSDHGHAHACTFTRRQNGDLDVQCGRQREMMMRAITGTASNKSLTMVFQDSSEISSGPTLQSAASTTCQC